MKTCWIESTKISRRSFLQALGALTLSGSLAACGGTGKAKSDRLAAGSLAYTPDEVVTVEFSDGGITVSPEDAAGLAVEGTALSVSGAGVYALSGSCADGSVKVEARTEDVVLLLDGLTLTSADTAPIVCGESTGVTIAVVDGTENTLTDSEANDPDNAADNENAEKAVVKCKDGSQVVLCGGGALTVNALGKNGIKSGTALDDRDASLTIRELTLNIEALVNDAINAEQRLKVESGNLTIAAGEDAIHCDMELNIGAEGTTGPAITVSTCCEGLEGAVLNIYSGNMDITSTDDCLNAANSDLGDYAFEINISGGTIKAYSSEGDGFDSNGTLTITGGDISVWTANADDNQHHDFGRHGAGRRRQRGHGLFHQRVSALRYLRRRAGQQPFPRRGRGVLHCGRKRQERAGQHRPLRRGLPLLLQPSPDGGGTLQRPVHRHRHGQDR